MIHQFKNFLLTDKIIITSFLSVGFITAVFYYSLFNFLWKICELNYSIAVTIAYLIAITLYFIANRHFTFKSKNTALTYQFSKFITMVILNYVITLIIVNRTVNILLLPPSFGVILAIFTTTIFNYFISKFWVFRSSKMIQQSENE